MRLGGSGIGLRSGLWRDDLRDRWGQGLLGGRGGRIGDRALDGIRGPVQGAERERGSGGYGGGEPF